MSTDNRPLKVFLCRAHIIPLWGADRDAVRAMQFRDVHTVQGN